METSLRVTLSTSKTLSLGCRHTLCLVESGSGDDRSNMSGKSVKWEKVIVARVKGRFYPVERPKRAYVTGKVRQDVGREMQGSHSRNGNSRAKTAVGSVNLDSLSISSSERPPRKLSRGKKSCADQGGMAGLTRTRRRWKGVRGGYGGAWRRTRWIKRWRKLRG